MQCDVMFFVGGIPDELLIRDKQFFIAPIAPTLRPVINTLGDQLPEFKQWTARWPDYSMAVFRNQAVSRDDAFWIAYQALSGILDGYSMLIEERLPCISSVVQIREQTEPDSAIY